MCLGAVLAKGCDDAVCVRVCVGVVAGHVNILIFCCAETFGSVIAASYTAAREAKQALHGVNRLLK